MLAALALAVMLYVAVRLTVVQALFAGGAKSAFRSDNVLDKLNIAALAVTEFAKLMVNPWSHSALLHPFKYETGAGLLWQAAAVTAVLLALFALAFWEKARFNFPLALLAALAMSWPTLHLISIPNVGNIISDRYALAPLALLLFGLAATAAGWLRHRLPSMAPRERRVLLYAGAACLLWTLALAAHSHATIPLWRNENSLWAFAYRQVPESDIAHKNYIKTLMIQGRWEEADADLKKYLQEHPEAFEDIEVADITNWMVIRAKSGDYEGALEIFGIFEREFNEARLKAMNDARTVGVLYRARGIIEGDVGHWGQALSWHEKAVQVSPTDMRSLFQYAHALFMNGQQEKADEVFGRALAGSTNDVAAWAQEWRKKWTPDDNQ
ncbi:MAG: tetratricopeptide repeat protein [Ottowia sp.]|nr:tetratricopeptide repeat protein [Ottowia sp.]